MYAQVAEKLGLPAQELELTSLRVFLNHRLRLVESQLLLLMQKYGVKTVSDLDKVIQNGAIHESGSFEDFFEFDNLEAERDIILEALKELN